MKHFPSKELDEEIIRKYAKHQEFSGARKGTSQLGVHLRFGTVSIRRTCAASQVN